MDKNEDEKVDENQNKFKLIEDTFEDKKYENEHRLMLTVETENPFEVLSTHNGHDADVHDHEPESSEVSKTDSVTRKPWREPWKCELCEKTFPWGYTFDQVYHMREHENEVKK